jgi:hypothetical protein
MNFTNLTNFKKNTAVHAAQKAKDKATKMRLATSEMLLVAITA